MDLEWVLFCSLRASFLLPKWAVSDERLGHSDAGRLPDGQRFIFPRSPRHVLSLLGVASAFHARRPESWLSIF